MDAAETRRDAVPLLTTPRLMLRPLELADAPAIQAVFPRFEIVALVSPSVPWPYPEGGALAFIRDVALPGMEAGREWHWSIRPQAEPGRIIGVVNLMDRDDDNRGFWLDPAWQGRGLMTEACAATADFWFGVLGKPVLREPKAAANAASRRVSEKCGLRVVRREERPYVSGRQQGEIWEITAEEWRAASRGGG